MQRKAMKKYRILVVDDDVMILQVLHDALTSEGYLCDTTGNGQKAIEKLSERTYSAVITDIKMPVLDGLELTRQIRAKYPDMGILVMTGYHSEYDYVEAVKAGANDFLQKPFKIKEILIRLSRILRDQSLLKMVKHQKQELQKMASKMIDGIEKEYSEKIKNLEEEIRNFENK